RDYYLRLQAAGKPHGVVINNVRNKLIHLVLSLVTNDVDYEADHLFNGVQGKGRTKNPAQLENIN
ncbi:MAG: hypothetical protein J5552_12270, partial [Prevotella sp.]|nr:hypothetical protein [Prevotella sp.]